MFEWIKDMYVEQLATSKQCNTMHHSLKYNIILLCMYLQKPHLQLWLFGLYVNKFQIWKTHQILQKNSSFSAGVSGEFKACYHFGLWFIV